MTAGQITPTLQEKLEKFIISIFFVK